MRGCGLKTERSKSADGKDWLRWTLKASVSAAGDHLEVGEIAPWIGWPTLVWSPNNDRISALVFFVSLTMPALDNDAKSFDGCDGGVSCDVGW